MVHVLMERIELFMIDIREKTDMLKNTLKSIFKNVLKFQTEKYLVYCS